MPPKRGRSKKDEEIPVDDTEEYRKKRDRNNLVFK